MREAMVLCGMLALALPGAARAAAPDHELNDVLDAFRGVCANTSDNAQNRLDALALGWQELPADSDSPVSRITQEWESHERMMHRPKYTESTEYVRTVSGRPLYLSITFSQRRDTAEFFTDTPENSCEVYDFSASKSPSYERLVQRIGAKPTDAEESPEGRAQYDWQVDPAQPNLNLQIFFAPTDSAIQSMTKRHVVGLTIAATAKEAGEAYRQPAAFNALDTAFAACFGTNRSLDGKREVPAREWRPYAPQTNEPLGTLRAYWERGAAIQQAELTQFELFRTEDAQPLYLLVTAIEGRHGPVSSGCRVFFPRDKQFISRTHFQEWSGLSADEFLIGVQANETRWGITGLTDEAVDASVSFLDPSIPLPPQAMAIPFHGTIIQFSDTNISQFSSSEVMKP